MNEIPQDKKDGARDYYEWFLAYQEAGFTEQQAMAILSRPSVVMNTHPAQYPPEVMEFWERNTSLATKLLSEMDE